MSSARESILGSIRRSLGVQPNDATRLQSVQTRLTEARPGIQPARGQGTLAERIATFTAQTEAVSATVTRVAWDSEVPGEIARYLRSHNLSAQIRRGADKRLATMEWDEAGLEVTIGPSDGSDLNAVSHAEGGIAETGTLALVSGSHNPTTLNFLPDNHIVIVRADTIDATYEDVFAKLRARFGAGNMPRTVNFITGPSRSADIEQKLLLGAHGPRRLHIVITGAL